MLLRRCRSSGQARRCASLRWLVVNVEHMTAPWKKESAGVSRGQGTSQIRRCAACSLPAVTTLVLTGNFIALVYRLRRVRICPAFGGPG
jgi:hypothetical protein